jgi:hypothetical protein
VVSARFPATSLAAALFAALLLPSVVEAQAPAAPAAAPADSRFALRWRGLELRGRVLVRSFSDTENQVTESDLEAENARLELRWRPRTWLRSAVEFDFADGNLKDVYVEVRPGRLELRAGQFKTPFSPVELESRWDLPASERGLLSDVLGDTFGITGRRPGVQVHWDPKKGPGLAATASLQRSSSARGDRIGDEAFNNVSRDWEAMTGTARLAWTGKRLGVGGGFSLRSAEPVPSEGYQRFWTAGADLTWRIDRRANLRVWTEAYAGSSWQDDDAFDGVSATFLAARVLAAWGMRIHKGHSLYLEPYAMVALFDPDASIRQDALHEVAGGVRLSGFDHLRLVVEAQSRHVSRNAPPSLGLFPDDGAPNRSRTRLVAQIGAAF